MALGNKDFSTGYHHDLGEVQTCHKVPLINLTTTDQKFGAKYFFYAIRPIQFIIGYDRVYGPNPTNTMCGNRTPSIHVPRPIA